MSLLSKKRVILSNKTQLKKVNLKIDKDMLIDEDVFIKSLKIRIPRVVGLSIKDAVSLLKSKDILFELVGKEVIPKEGTVYKTYPCAGEYMVVTDKLKVYVNDHTPEFLKEYGYFYAYK